MKKRGNAMSGVKIYNIVNGEFYTLYGLWGLILPQRILSFFDIETYGVYALHNIRAMWAVCAVLGLLILWKSRSTSAVMVCMIMALVVGAFAVGRLTGLAIDGMDGGVRGDDLRNRVRAVLDGCGAVFSQAGDWVKNRVKKERLLEPRLKLNMTR